MAGEVTYIVRDCADLLDEVEVASHIDNHTDQAVTYRCDVVGRALNMRS